MDDMSQRLDAALEKAKRIVAEHDAKCEACNGVGVRQNGEWCDQCETYPSDAAVRRAKTLEYHARYVDGQA